MRSLYVASFALALLGCEQTPPPQAPSCGCNPPPEPKVEYVQEKPANPDGHFHVENR